MKFSKGQFIFIAAILLLTQSACNDLTSLDKHPLDEVSNADYWTTPKDLRLFVNQFYPSAFPVSGSDRYENIFADAKSSDDMAFVEADPRLRGSRTVPGSGGMSNYDEIRSTNVFLGHYDKVKAPFDEYKQYVGEDYFFRAKLYFSLVKKYGAVPLILKPLSTDSDELHKPKAPRSQVVDSILADLDRSIDLLPSGPQKGGTRLNKQVAQLFKSRVALYEGTWEKYHKNDAFAVSNPEPEKYLGEAIQAAENVMNSGIYHIHSTGKPEWDYFNMFGKVDYSNNEEVLLWKKYDVSKNLGHARQFQMGTGKSGGSGITKSLVESYLCSNGKPIFISNGSKNPLYLGDNTLDKTTTHRDPRLTQTIFTSGFPIEIQGGDTLMKYDNAAIELPAHTKNTTGYQLSKFLNFDPVHHESQTTSGVGFTGWIIMRYAEVLLNYAEAKAELGTITQSDLDKSINKLRQRVGMPNLSMSIGFTDPNWHFPNLSPIINEIRRERRVELVGEGFRWDDIARWTAADELIVGQRLLGAKFNLTDYPDLNPDDFSLTNGYFDPQKKQLPNGFQFDINRDYLSPFSTEELKLNDALKQNPGW